VANPWLVRVNEAIGKAIPNEMSKGSSVWQYIPYIGQAVKALGAVDAGATAGSDYYNQGKDLGNAPSWYDSMNMGVQGAYGSWMGGSDPGMYGSSGNKLKRGWVDYMNLAGGLYGSLGGGSKGFGGKANAGGIAGAGLNIYDATQGDSDWNYGVDPYNPQPSRNPEWEQYARNIASLAASMQQNSQRRT
jgi:hypothetical protein